MFKVNCVLEKKVDKKWGYFKTTSEIPSSPGVYAINADGRYIFVGSGKNLKNAVFRVLKMTPGVIKDGRRKTFIDINSKITQSENVFLVFREMTEVDDLKDEKNKLKEELIETEKVEKQEQQETDNVDTQESNNKETEKVKDQCEEILDEFLEDDLIEVETKSEKNKDQKSATYLREPVSELTKEEMERAVNILMKLK